MEGQLPKGRAQNSCIQLETIRQHGSWVGHVINGYSKWHRHIDTMAQIPNYEINRFWTIQDAENSIMQEDRRRDTVPVVVCAEEVGEWQLMSCIHTLPHYQICDILGKSSDRLLWTPVCYRWLQVICDMSHSGSSRLNSTTGRDTANKLFTSILQNSHSFFCLLSSCALRISIIHLQNPFLNHPQLTCLSISYGSQSA